MTDTFHSKPNTLLSSAFWNILCLAVTAVAGLITVPIVIRGIGTSNYGLYSIIIMVGGFMALQNLGLGEATLRFVAKYYARNDLEGVNRVLGATLFVYCITGALGCSIILLFAPNIIGIFKVASDHIGEGITALRIAGIGFFLTAFLGALQKIPEATQRYDVSSKILMVVTIVRCAAMITVVKLGGGIIGLAGILVANAAVNIIVYYFVAHSLIPGLHCFPHLRRDGLKEVFSYGIFSFINQLIHNISIYVDRFILGIFFGTTDVGYLTAPKDLLVKAQGLSGAAGRALFPRFSAMEEGPEMQRLYSFSLWSLTCFSVVIFIPTAIVMPVFLSCWISPEFSEHSATVSRLLALGMACNGGTGSYFALLKGTGRIKWVTWIYSTVAVFSIVVTAWLVLKYGLIGTGIKMVLFAWIGAAICMIVGKKVFPSFKLGRVALESSIIPILSGGVAFYVGNKVLVLLDIQEWFGIIVYSGICAVLIILWQLGINVILFRKNGAGMALLEKINQNNHVKKIATVFRAKK